MKTLLASLASFTAPTAASSAADLPLGSDVEVRLVEADIATRKVRFEL